MSEPNLPLDDKFQDCVDQRRTIGTTRPAPHDAGDENHWPEQQHITVPNIDDDAHPGPGGDPVVEVVWRLYGEFNGRRPVKDIIETVQRCRRDLDCITPDSLPEMTERLARQRLHELR